MGLFDIKKRVKRVAEQVVGSPAVSTSFRASKVKPPLPAVLVDFVSINKAQDVESGMVLSNTYIFNIELLTTNYGVTDDEADDTLDQLFTDFQTALEGEFRGFDVADFWPHDVLWGPTNAYCGAFQLSIVE